MIEVLHFGLSDNRGGIETYIKKIWDHIDHSAFRFSFIDMTGDNKRPCFYDELSESGCRFFKITPRKVSVWRNREDIKKLFSDNHFDILHFSVNTLSYIYPVEVALKNGCRVIVHSRSALASNRITRIIHYLNRIRINHLKVAKIAISREAGKWLFGNAEFLIYPNGVDTEAFAFNGKSRDNIRTVFKCEGKEIIGHVGSFLPVKNHEFMLEVFSNYTKRNSNAVLWFVGDGPLKREMERIAKQKNIENKVFFLGECQNVSEIYDAMDMLWFPSLFEGLGNVVLEAECKGLPCLISDKVPKSTMVLENVYSFSLNETIDRWSDMLDFVLSQRVDDRFKCKLILSEKGWSVQKEVEKLELLYHTIV